MSKSKRITGIVTASVLFQVFWYLLVRSAGETMSLWVAVAAAAAVFGLVFVFTETPLKGVAFVLAALGLGCLMDTLLTIVGCIDPARHFVAHPFPPVWLIGLWVAFAGFVRISLRYLCGRPLVQCAAGVFGGPAAYFAGAKMGAVSVHANLARGYGLLAVSWGVMCLILFGISCRLHAKSEEVAK